MIHGLYISSAGFGLCWNVNYYLQNRYLSIEYGIFLWPIKFGGHRPSNLGSLHGFGSRYVHFQSVGLDKPNRSPPYTGCLFKVDPLGSPKTPSLAWRPIKFCGHRLSNMGSLHGLGGRYIHFQSVGLDKPNGSPPYTECHFEVDPLGSPKTPSLAWRPIKFGDHRPTTWSWRSICPFSECWAGQT